MISNRHGSIHDYIGFRTISTQGSDILLNGESIFLNGISIHEENPFRVNEHGLKLMQNYFWMG